MGVLSTEWQNLILNLFMKTYFVSRIIPMLRQTKNYARIVGVILFLIGLFGFAFRSDNSLPDLYLGAALVLGFWGIVSGLWDSGN